MELCGRRYDTGQPVRLALADGKIARAAFCPVSPATERWPWLAPGLIDLQVNGCHGIEFSSASLQPDDVYTVARHMAAGGVVRFCPTLTTDCFEVLAHGVQTIAAAAAQMPPGTATVAGIHLEGPYISAEDGPRGAHPQAHCRPPDWDEFQRLQAAADGTIRLLTLAPELPGATRLIARAAAADVVVAIGHTAAKAADIAAAVDAGARLCTHLGNGSHRTLPRHPNYLWDQIAEDRLWASIIADGHHLPPAVVQTILRGKTPGRCLLISDMAGQAGLPPGTYRGNLCAVDVLPSGRLVVAGQTEMLAGASLPVGAGVANAMRFAGLSLATAIDLAAGQPARLLDLPCGGLAPGDPADLVLFDLIEADNGTVIQFIPRATILAGKTIFGECTVG